MKYSRRRQRTTVSCCLVVTTILLAWHSDPIMALAPSSNNNNQKAALHPPTSRTTIIPHSSSSSSQQRPTRRMARVPVVWEEDAVFEQARHRLNENDDDDWTTDTIVCFSDTTPPGENEESSSSSSSSSPKMDPRLEFELHVGRALDTLRSDYPKILISPPDFSIYDNRMDFVDPSGINVHSLTAYKNSFRVLHALVKVLYCPNRSKMQYRMCFDKARQNIRIHWNAAVLPRELFGLRSNGMTHVDGISIYELDRETGRIVQHRIEQLLLNNMPLQPKEGVVAALNKQHGMSVPSFCEAGSVVGNSEASSPNAVIKSSSNTVVPFQQFSPWFSKKSSSSLFAMEASESNSNNKNTGSTTSDRGPSADGGRVLSTSTGSPGTDTSGTAATAVSSTTTKGPPSSVSSTGMILTTQQQQAYEAKNKSRKKFGLKPLTIEEFQEIEVQVQQMDTENRQRAAAAAAAAAAEKKKPNRNGGGLLDKLFGTVLLQDTCESNFDCERPEICCDFGFKKMCCQSGSLVGQQQPADWQLAPVPVPVNIQQPDTNQQPPPQQPW